MAAAGVSAVAAGRTAGSAFGDSATVGCCGAVSCGGTACCTSEACGAGSAGCVEVVWASDVQLNKRSTAGTLRKAFMCTSRIRENTNPPNAARLPPGITSTNTTSGGHRPGSTNTRLIDRQADLARCGSPQIAPGRQTQMGDSAIRHIRPSPRGQFRRTPLPTARMARMRKLLALLALLAVSPFAFAQSPQPKPMDLRAVLAGPASLHA